MKEVLGLGDLQGKDLKDHRARLIEGEKTIRRINAITPIARNILKNTPSYKEKLASSDDVEALKEFYIKIAPYAHPNTFPDFWAHNLAVGIAMGKIAEKTGVVDPTSAEFGGLWHDFSSLLEPHHYYRKNVLAIPLGKYLKTRKEYSGQDDIVPRILAIKKPHINSTEDMSHEEIIEDLIDNTYKPDSSGKLNQINWSTRGRKSHEDQINKYKKAKYLRPSVKAGMHARLENRRSEVAQDLIIQEKKWLEKKFGLDLKQIRKDVQEELDGKDCQKFLFEVRNAQETLDPKVDEKLGRKPIEVIVFDAGKVLIDVSDDELVEKIAKKLNITIEKVWEAFIELNPKAFGGEISNDKYYEQFAKVVSIEKVIQKDFEFPELYRPVPGMQNVVKKLSKSNVELQVYSNVISPLAPMLEKKLIELYPEIDSKKLLYSCNIKANKQHKDSFETVVNLVIGGRNIDPEQLLFIDDVEKYTTSARAFGGMRAITFRGNPYKDVSPTERLIFEIQKAKLI